MPLPVDQSTKNDEILEAARTVFIRHGIKKATMDDIAKMISITRTALYYYYKNKQDLLTAVLDQEIYTYERDLDDAIGRIVTPVEKLAALSSCYCDFHTSIRSLFKFDSGDYLDNYDLLKTFKVRVLNVNENAIRKILEDDPYLSGTVRAGRYARLLGMSLRGVLFNSADMDDESRRSALGHMCSIFYYGLGAMPRNTAKQ
jgi:AcrR family transcriptional regulator